jgi:hypothetical protein
MPILINYLEWNMKKILMMLGAALVFAGCNMPFAQAQTTSFVANNDAANPAHDGRLYPIADALLITQISLLEFDILNPDGSVSKIADTNGAKFAAIPKNWTPFALEWINATQTGSAVYVHATLANYATCAGSGLTLGFTASSPLHGTQNYTDGNCAGYNAVFNKAN